ncbi:DUF7676 family protein [Methylocystis echinoides]|uniref:Uncharacterized protein n=1 Tax=Methylocystis echinoides TaxID=29468 RepID=A0A9W6GY65_9HYPH|nr:hypothetical protein [Methylocystis echinoides]RTL85978.1 MAG: hypothetical protein EKK29_10690 [Hyphomicrobiales bacterium]GLI95101.1 hypothetical protein LMG27198_40930 [Methylocystis echinoides]
MTVAPHEVTPKRTYEPDGTPLDVFPLPTDQTSLEELLRDLFQNHWQEIAFGILIQGAAWEMKADRAPTRIGTLDGYLTVAFGVPHFHICIGEHKGPRSRPTPPEVARHRRTARAEIYRRIGRSCAPMSWGVQLFNGAGEQQITVLLPNPFLHPDTDKILKEPDWSRLALWDKLRSRWFGLHEPDPVDRSASRFAHA